MRCWLSGPVILICLLFAAGCSPTHRGTGCTVDGDCPVGEGCVDGQCEAVDCRLDVDCDGGQVCLDYTCVDQGTCTSDGQCPQGSICVDATCLAGCRADADCPDGSLCRPDLGDNGECVDCREDDDCDAGERCVDGSCRAECNGDQDCPGGHCDPASSTCVECLEDGQCGQGEICQNGSCQTGCRIDAACPQGQICLGGQCQTGCRDDVGCPQGQICQDGQCQTGCRVDLDCPQGQVCDPDTRTCLSVGCAASSDCDPGQICLAGNCVAGCEGNRDCPQGQVCDPDAGPHGECVDCLIDADCPDGHTCVDQECTPANPACHLLVAPTDPVNFGNVPVYGIASQTFTVTSVGTGACTITELELRSIAGDANPAFAFSWQPELPLVLAPAGQAYDEVQIDVIFFPESLGEHTATFWLRSDDPDLNVGQNLPACQLGGNWTPGTACVPLHGAGEATCDGLAALPAAVVFGEVLLGCPSQEIGVRVYNTGLSPRSVADVWIDPPANSEFEIRQLPAMPITLQPGDLFEVALRYTPSHVGLDTANLMLRSGMTNCELAVPLLAAGVEDAAAEDVFVQPPSPVVDVLWVIDNSASMGPIQDALAEAAVEFVQWAIQVGLDFHIGVVTTDMEDPTQSGRLQGEPRFITPQTPDAAAALAAKVQVGIDGSPIEMGLAASAAALSEPLSSTYNDGFLRGGGAELNVIYVSDEEDQSPMGTDFYVDLLIWLKGYLELIDVSAVVGDPPDGCDNPGTGYPAEAGLRYLDLVDAFSGMFQSVCGPDWAALFGHLGMADLTPQRSFVLTRPAVAGSIVARIDGQLVPEASSDFAADGWTFLAIPGFNGLWFGDDVIPPYGSELVVQYQATCP